jgi:hypothetical protein
MPPDANRTLCKTSPSARDTLSKQPCRREVPCAERDLRCHDLGSQHSDDEDCVKICITALLRCATIPTPITNKQVPYTRSHEAGPLRSWHRLKHCSYCVQSTGYRLDNRRNWDQFPVGADSFFTTASRTWARSAVTRLGNTKACPHGVALICTSSCAAACGQ